MQKILKSKINYKKSPTEKQFYHKYQYKNSNTLSTNQSKIHHSSEKSCFMNISSINFSSIIGKNLRKYGNSNDLLYLTDFEGSFARSRSRQKILLKDYCHQKNEQFLQDYYSNNSELNELQQLFEYYKYYINNPIIFGKQHFKTLYNFYQKKKYLQYKSLKAVLDLDDQKQSQLSDSMNQNISFDNKKSTKQTTKTFYIMNLIHTDLTDKSNQSQSKAFLQLNKNLQKILNKNIYESPNLYQNTPTKYNFEYADKNGSGFNFKKKKLMPSTIYSNSNKNTVSKKSKKQSFNNSNSSLKKLKLRRTSQQSNPFKFQQDIIPYLTTKTKPDTEIRKKRHGSHLSMGDMEIKFQTSQISNLLGQKNYKKKRMNSCQTVIDRHSSKQKQIIDKKRRKLLKDTSKSRFQKNQDIQLTQFQQYLKKMAINNKKSIKRQKNCQQNTFGSLNKVKKVYSRQKIDEQMRFKKIKKKLANNSSTCKNSIQKSPVHHGKKQVAIQQNIINLKKKIRMAKQSIKITNSNSNSNLQYQKKDKINIYGSLYK